MLIMNRWHSKIHLLCFLACISYSRGEAQCDNVNSMDEVTDICSSTEYEDNCIVVVMNSNHADCEAFCNAAGSSCLDGWDSHGGSCGNIDQTDDTWPQGCGGDNLFHDGICMCAADGSNEDGSDGTSSGGKVFTYHQGPKSWNDARDDCLSRGGDLAIIHSEDENDAAFASLGSSAKKAYIGLFQTSTDSSFEWADGSALDYVLWGQGEPNNHGDSRGTEDCAGFLFDDKTWNDFHCDGTAWDDTDIGYVCQSKNNGDHCDSGWTYIETGCFQYFPKSLLVIDNESAEFDCNQKGGYLASVIGVNQNNAVYDLVGSRMALIGLRGTQSLVTNERIWSWTDGYDGNYTNWVNSPGWTFGYPNNATFPEMSTFFYHSEQWISCDSSGNSSCWSQWDGYLCKVPASYQMDKSDDRSDGKSDDTSPNPGFYPPSKTVNTINTGYIDSGASAVALSFVIINFVIILVLICKHRRASAEGNVSFYNPMLSSNGRSSQRTQRVALDESSISSESQVEML